MITSTPWVASASVAVRGAARETTTVSGIARASATSLELSGSRASESNTTRRGWRTSLAGIGQPRGQQRIVGHRRPDPDATASTAARHWCER